MADPASTFEFSSDPSRVDRDFVFAYLSGTYWAGGIPRETFDTALDGSTLFGLYDRGTGAQVAFARMVTDRATFAWLADVFVVDDLKGQGLGKHLTECILSEPWIPGMRRLLLATADAHGLYERSGFGPLKFPDRFMERLDRRLYDGPE